MSEDTRREGGHKLVLTEAQIRALAQAHAAERLNVGNGWLSRGDVPELDEASFNRLFALVQGYSERHWREAEWMAGDAANLARIVRRAEREDAE